MRLPSSLSQQMRKSCPASPSNARLRLHKVHVGGALLRAGAYPASLPDLRLTWCATALAGSFLTRAVDSPRAGVCPIAIALDQIAIAQDHVTLIVSHADAVRAP